MIRINKIDKIQEIRAIQALSDINIDLHIDKNEAYKFFILKKKFNMVFKIPRKEENAIDYDEIITIDHSIPNTSIFSISKPLIYSKKITSYLKSKWPDKRRYKFSFSGLITAQRKIKLENWINTNGNKKIEIRDNTLILRVIRKINNYINVGNILIQQYDDFYLWSSTKGRTFPIKTWDENYYEFILKSEFVLCPSGDYIWTYRFFEAIMCGAIPVVEETCQSYDGFKFYMMNEDKNIIRYDKEIVDYNFELLVNRLTIDHAEYKVIRNKIMQLAKNKCL